MAGLGGMFKQLQQVQQRFQAAVQELSELTMEGEAGGGAVKATVSGDKKLVSLKIDPSAVDSEDMEMLEDLVVAAVRNAVEEVQAIRAEKLQRAAGGLPIPPELLNL